MIGVIGSLEDIQWPNLAKLNAITNFTKLGENQLHYSLEGNPHVNFKTNILLNQWIFGHLNVGRPR